MTAPSDYVRAKRRPVLRPYSRADANLSTYRIALPLVVAFCMFCVPFGFFFALVVPYLFIVFMAPLGILALVTIWALPQSRTAPTTLLSPLLFAFIIALFLWPNYLAIALPGLPWITVIRLTSFPLALTFLICLSVSETFRAQLKATIDATPTTWKALVLFVCAQVVAIPLSQNLTQSFQSFLIAQTAWTAIFFISTYVFLKPGRTFRWMVLMWCIALILGGLGVLEADNKRVMWGSHIPGFLKVGDEVVQRILAGGVRSATGQYRVQATFSTALGLSEFCALTLPLILHFISTSKSFFVKLSATLTIPFLIHVILLTDSRLGLLGCFLSITMYLFVWGLLRWMRDRASLAGPALIMAYPVLFAFAAASTFLVGRIRNRVWGTGQYAASNEGRMAQIESGLPKIATHPLGYGPGMGGEALGYHNRAGVRTIDNYLLSVGLEVGIFGLIVFVLFFSSSAYYALKYTFKYDLKNTEYEILIPLSIGLMNFVVIKTVFANDDNHPMIYMMAGIVTALVYRLRSEREPELLALRAKPLFQFRRRRESAGKSQQKK